MKVTAFICFVGVALMSTLLLPNSAVASERYVNVDVLNVRDGPGGNVVSTLSRGSVVTAIAFDGEWVRISQGDQPPRWVSTDKLCSTVGCWQRVPAASRSTVPAGNYPVAPLRGGYAAQCPCSGTKNCIGPRGGSFCITSGGNKRYR